MSNDRFNQEKEKYLIDNWGTKSIDAIRKDLKLTWSEVADKADELGLPRNKIASRWNNQDTKKLKELAPSYNYKIVANMMGKSPGVVLAAAKRLSITLIMEQNYVKN